MVLPKRTRNFVKNQNQSMLEAKAEKILRLKRAKKVVLKPKKKITESQKLKIREKNRKASQQRREKIKNEPELYEENKEKERQRYYQRKAQGKIKSVKQLSEREQRRRRVNERNRKRAYRQSLKDAKEGSSCSTSSDFTHKNESSMPTTSRADIPKTCIQPVLSKQSIAGKKRTSRRQAKCYRDMNKVIDKNAKLETKVNTLRKKVSRLKAEIAKSKESANDEIHSSVDQMLSDPKGNRKNIRNELISGRVLNEQIKEVYKNCKSHSVKNSISQILAGKVVSKYRCKKKFSASLAKGIKAIKEPKDLGHVLLYRRKEKKSSTFLRSEIQEFYLENSAVDPGKKHCKKINSSLTTRQFLNASMVDLYRKFCNEKNKFVSLSTFCKYRPSYCVAPKLSTRNTCACPTHENFNFLVQCLFKHKIISENSTHKVVQSLTCDKITRQCFERSCSNCKSKEIMYNTYEDLGTETTYKRWASVTEKRISGKTKKEIQVSFVSELEYQSTVGDVVEIFKNDIESFLLHEMRIFHQFNAIKNLKTNILAQKKAVDGLFLWDFSENWNCKYHTEIQGVHFGAARQQVCLHTGYIYTPSITEGYCTLSSDLSHESTAVIAHMREIFDFYIPNLKDLQNIHFLSDGPTAQYRNKSMFFLITQYLPSFYANIVSLTYNFTESHHGKGPADSQGGILKTVGDNAVKYGENVNTFDKFVETLKKCVRKIHISTVTSEDIQNVENFLLNNDEKVQQFKGTMRVHQYTWSQSNPKVVQLNTLSCFDCKPGEKCEHFSLGELDYDKIKIKKTKRDQNQNKKSVKKPKITDQIENEQQLSNSECDEHPYNENSNILKRNVNSKAQKSRTTLRKRKAVELVEDVSHETTVPNKKKRFAKKLKRTGQTKKEDTNSVPEGSIYNENSNIRIKLESKDQQPRRSLRHREAVQYIEDDSSD